MGATDREDAPGAEADVASGRPGEVASVPSAHVAPERPAEYRTFLIADIRGYTSYTDERGDEAAAALARQFAGLVRETVEARDGFLAELRGDEALTIFASPRQALRAAVELQGRIAAEQLPRGIGIGLDAGEAVPVEGGYRGTALNVAARLCAQAAAGEILATETVIHLAARIEGIRYREPKSIRLKGFESPVRVVGVQAEAAAEAAGRTRAKAGVRALERRPAFAALVAVAVLVVGGALVFAQGLGGRGSAAPGASTAGRSDAGSVRPGGSLARESLAPGDSPGPGASGALTGPGESARPATAPGPAADVPGYKGGLARTNDLPGPPLGATPEVRWRFDTATSMGSAPAVAGNVAYAGDKGGTLHAIDLATGQEAWSFAAGAQIAVTPTVADGAVYVTTEDGVLHAVDLASHAERWHVAGVTPGAIPSVLDGVAYVGLAAGQFAALSVTDGREAWHVDVDGTAGRAAIADGTAYVDGEGSDRLYAVDLTAHAIRWTAATGADQLLTPAVDGGTVYLTASAVAGKDSRVTAFDAATGAERWRFSAPERPNLGALAVGPDLVFSSSDGPNGTTNIWAVDRATGKLRWKAPVPGSFAIHPTLVGDEVDVISTAGTVVALTATTGKEIWRSPAIGRAVGSPVVTGGLLLESTSGGTAPAGVVALAPSTGSPATVPASAIEWVTDLTAGDGKETLYLNVIVDAKGNVYGADRVGDRVVIWDRDGHPKSWGRHGSKPGQFDFSEVTLNDQSQSVAIARDGRIAVGDGGNHRVQVFDRKRHFLLAIGHEGKGTGEFINPCCVAFDPAGRLYVADPGRGDLQVFDKTGRYVRTIGSQGSGNGQFDRLGVPYIDPATGDLWVPDFANRRIEVMTPDGQFVTAFGDDPGEQALANTNGVVLDRAGRMWIVDTDDFVYVLDPTGKLIARFGPEEVAGHGYVAPAYLWLTDDGKLYLPDTDNSRIAVFQLRAPLWPPPGG
jgi:eukaryotic-like serine/threonine-protein kinase